MKIESVAVFCGSKMGSNPIYAQHAAELGKLIAVLDLKLVYGGGNKGLMGIIADEILKHEGQIIGVIPKLLIEWEAKHERVTEMAIVPDMHARKKMMFDLFEMLTWNQLKIHDKRIYMLNSGGFYNHLLHHLRLLEKEGFLYEKIEERIVICNTPIEIFNKIS